MSETHDLRINRIKHGTVLDHIVAGRAFNVLSALDINGTDGNQVSVAMNVSSKQYKKKDIIKIENRILANVASSIWGKEYLYKKLLDVDKQAQEALQHFDEAKALIGSLYYQESNMALGIQNTFLNPCLIQLQYLS